MTFIIGELTIGEWDLDLSTPDFFKELLSRPDFELTYLVELSPYDQSLAVDIAGGAPAGVNPIGVWGFSYQGGVNTIRFSDRGYVTMPTDTPSNANYKPFSENPFQFDTSIFDGDFKGSLGSFGAIKILNGDGEFDALTNYYWEGRGVTVLAGSKDFTRNQFVTVFDGICDSIEHDESEITINIQNKEKTLESEFTQNIYGGTGGLDGGDDLAEKVKPLLYGECLRISPVLIDPANLVYQVHDGAMQAIDAVYDRGVALTSGGDVTDITVASVAAGQFKTQLSGGYIKLGSTPDGQLTADAKGDNNGGYVSKCGAIISRLLRTKLGLFNLTGADIDQGSFNRLDNEVTGDIGVYLNTVTNVRNIINAILTPLQCYWTYTRDGLITVGVASEPNQSLYEFNETNIIDGDISVSDVYSPSWRINLGYARAWTSQNEIAAGASEDYRSFAQQEYRKIIKEDRNVRTLATGSSEKFYDSFLINEADALTQATRIEALYNKQRKVYKLTVKDLLFRVFIGDTVTIKLNRFGLDDGQDFVIVSLSEDAETNLTELEVWG